MKLNKKAFTLTELLMVVLMIGIISAMVLPKFNKVVDSFRVLEAERMMRAVRNEQETRCTLGKKYTVAANKVKAFVKNKTSDNIYTTTNFTYTLSGGGIIAESDKGYTLRMPSYLDGRVCCNECDSFTKNYLLCSDLEDLEDFQEVKNDDTCKP